MNVKNNKIKKPNSDAESEEFGKFKPKKKPVKLKDEGKVNVKSKKFWQERYDDEGEDLEKYIR
ncbi:MAG: hypothetical protein IPN49_16085 [Saprospiraceae bacterium]|nr:hypothetical protein [Saprospiraceae bacterium]MBK6565980.1 hypothetical protein [Saprospiraceae bacterium]MBK6784924.1 hypothetical protein [Saprospiraceae bacterium]MBK7525849.1 hypothetical protein [Saprospiraceae bacterium]MBK8370001.1 hypothetical protein [Saprospiraceae bacterium]